MRRLSEAHITAKLNVQLHFWKQFCLVEKTGAQAFHSPKGVSSDQYV